MKQVRIRVSGHVQGVGFRYNVYRKALKIGLLGYVKNLDNGDVDIVAQGDDLQLAQLIHWLEQGQIMFAQVSNFVISESPYQEILTSFNVRY